jgi:hypothetical protein
MSQSFDREDRIRRHLMLKPLANASVIANAWHRLTPLGPCR